MAKKKDSFGDSPVGSGGRFAECVRTMRRRKNVEDPEGLCASIGRKKYGKRRFQEMASKGRKAAGNPFVPDSQVRQIARHIAENTMMFVLPSDTRAIAEAAAEELWELTGERPRRSLVLHVVNLARYYYEALKRSTKRHHMEENPFSSEVYRWREIRDQAGRLRQLAAENIQKELEAYWKGWEDAIHLLNRIAMKRDASGREGFDVTAQEFGRLFRQVPTPTLTLRENPLSDEQHMATKKTTMELAQRMQRLAMHEDSLGHNDQGDHWREMAQYIDGAGWAHRRAAQGIPFPSPGYAGTSGLEGAEVEVQQELEAAAAANPVKADGKWHRETTGEGVILYGMKTAKGLAWVIPYKPRKSRDARAFAAYYEQDKGSKIPKGTKWMTALVSGVSVTNITAHKTLDDAKRAGENALRKLPMPNPAPRLVNEGILAGSRPIPSGLDSPRYNEGILAGSQPIPSGLGSPRVNVGLVDPPITRRTKPEQPF